MAKPSPLKAPPGFIAPAKQPRGGKEFHQSGLRREFQSRKARTKRKKSSSKRNKPRGSEPEDSRGPDYASHQFQQNILLKQAQRLARRMTENGTQQVVPAAQVADDSATLAKKLKALEEENARLKKNSPNATASTPGVDVLVRTNAQITDQCKAVGRDVIFRTIQFFKTHAEWNKAVTLALQYIPQYVEIKEKPLKEAWIKSYRSWFASGMGDKRNYVQGRLKDVYWALMDKGKALPSVDQLLKCATRNVSSTTRVFVCLATNHSPLGYILCFVARLMSRSPQITSSSSFIGKTSCPRGHPKRAGRSQFMRPPPP